MFRQGSRRRYRRGLWPVISRIFYIHPQKQYMLIVISAIIMAAAVFMGLFRFRTADQGDMLLRGNWYIKQGKAALAVKEFEQLTRRHRDNYEAHLALGKAYMEVDEEEKAAKEFRIASRLRAKNPKESGAHVALSRMMIAQGNYQDAERQLFQAYKAREQNKKDPELLMAMVDLYEDWGDYYMEKDAPDYEKAFLKYSAGLRYVRTYNQQKPLQEKLVRTADHLSGQYDNNKDYNKAIAVLKRALQYDPSADNHIKVAEMYEKKEDLDKAIDWYRKAYELDPRIISLKLSNMLMKKGRELNEAHLAKEAEKYFAEAKRINETVKLPHDTLYPVKAVNVKLDYKVNADAFSLVPTVVYDIKNDGSYPINFMATRVYFMTGNDKLADANKVIANSNDPLAPRGEPKGARRVELTPASAIPLEDLEKGQLRVQIFVSYTRDENTKWYEVKNAETVVAEAKQMEGKAESR